MGEKLLKLQVRRMADSDPVRVEPHSQTILDMCLFLSLLLALYPLKVSRDDPRFEKLAKKLQGWCKEYKDTRTGQIAGTCIKLLQPWIDGGDRLSGLQEDMRRFEHLQLYKCGLQGCEVSTKSEEKTLVCGRCKTTTYVRLF